MIEQLSDFPSNVVAFRRTGRMLSTDGAGRAVGATAFGDLLSARWNAFSTPYPAVPAPASWLPTSRTIFIWTARGSYALLLRT
jgi:hypothetical protein